MVTCECGLSYVPDVPEDQEAHARLHKEYAQGPLVPESAARLDGIDLAGYKLIVVDASVPTRLRHDLAYVAMVAHRSMPQYPAGYDGTINDGDQRLFLMLDGRRAIGLAITAREQYFWKLSWSESGPAKLVESEQHQMSRQTVGRVWMANQYRRRGLATQLLHWIARYLGMQVDQLGWELPLTDTGRALLQTVAPQVWWGRGDIFALQDTIQPNRFP